jgi:hypothetical protein
MVNWVLVFMLCMSLSYLIIRNEIKSYLAPQVLSTKALKKHRLIISEAFCISIKSDQFYEEPEL